MAVLYVSRSLKEMRDKNRVTDLEALSVVWAVNTFKLFITKTRFKVVTYCNMLISMLTFPMAALTYNVI